jgi:hypothetical protein
MEDRYHVLPGGFLRWLVCDSDRDDETVAIERSYELAQERADELNRNSGIGVEPA